MKFQDVDLVISSEAQQDLLVKYLFSRLKTVDGVKGSAKPFLEKMMK